MNLIPSKDSKGIWTITVIILILVGIMFLNIYTGPNRQPLFGFLKKKTPAPTA